MRILVACEFSGVVRDAFLKNGHDAWSCDLLPSDSDYSTNHIQEDVRSLICDRPHNSWDMLIAFPPCTHIARSGGRYFEEKRKDGRQREALELVRKLLYCSIHRICLENPVGIISTRFEKPTQIIQPWQFGHGEVKATCLWLKNLPKLKPTKIVSGRIPRVHYEAPTSSDGSPRWKRRSITYKGIAEAMAEQWSRL